MHTRVEAMITLCLFYSTHIYSFSSSVIFRLVLLFRGTNDKGREDDDEESESRDKAITFFFFFGKYESGNFFFFERLIFYYILRDLDVSG